MSSLLALTVYGAAVSVPQCEETRISKGDKICCELFTRFRVNIPTWPPRTSKVLTDDTICLFCVCCLIYSTFCILFYSCKSIFCGF